jgi:prepilin-type N-terminal cleavage/methylation domain-containing protein
MTPRHSAARRRRGFTAVEIAMVASVIAILALLILPVFRQRAEDARQAAARDELASIVKALLLVEADIPGGRHLPQLSDLDNLELPDGTVPPGTNPEQEPGRSRWYSDPITPALSRFVLPGEIPAFYSNAVYQGSVAPAFRGPYLAMKNTLSLAAIAAQFPQLTTANGGPITIFTTPPFTPTALANDRYPVDPWGTPYLLFGPEGETIYNFRAVYSLGPDGLPGGTAERAFFGGGLPPNAFRRQGGLLGRGDDLEFRF